VGRTKGHTDGPQVSNPISMTAPVFTYRGTSDPVEVGDRIVLRRWLGLPRLATVVYIPGKCEPDADLAADQWAFRLDGGPVYAVGYFPAQIPHPSKRIQLLSRAGRTVSLDLPPDDLEGRPGRDLLVIMGAAAIIGIVLGLAVAIWRAIR
jgi:hypothetical protein